MVNSKSTCLETLLPVALQGRRMWIPRQGATLAFLEETASKALKAKSSAEAGEGGSCNLLSQWLTGFDFLGGFHI